MRALILTTLVIIVGTSAAYAIPAPPIISRESRKFDHAKHEASAANATSSARQKAACADCHQMDANGAPKKGKEHAHRCVKCHQDPATCTAQMKTSQAPSNPARRCVTCHVFQKCVPANLPAPPAQTTFQAGFSHGKHIGFGMAIEKDCARCHKDQAPAGTAPSAAGAGHASCSGCHGATGRAPSLPMTNCVGCHKPFGSKPGGTSNDPYQLATFDHRKHHAKSNPTARGGESACTQCHTTKKLSGTSGDLPRPAMLECQNACHNGTRAFSAVGTKCTTCHTVSNAKPPKNDASATFSHSKHAARNTNISNCAACHELKPDGNLEPHGTNKNHMPCAASGCHQTEFASKTTKICGVCHDESAPWQKAQARTKDPTIEEWFETINHSTHLARAGSTNAACGACHGDKLGGGRKPGDHDACIQCHGKGAPAHPMTDCSKCHLQTKPASAVASEWSVRTTFKHESHSTDPRSRGANQCASCHAEVKNAKDLASIKKPTMESCGRCHDGKLTFKTTGYECSKCHTKPNQASTPTALNRFNGDPSEGS